MPEDSPNIRRTFATASGEYIGDLTIEQRKLEKYGDFLSDQLEEAALKRQEEEEDVGLFGTLFSIIGAGIGCIIGSATPAGPAGCIKGATIGAGAGSLGGRFGADWLLHKGMEDEYGLTEEELASLSPTEFKYIQDQYYDIHDEAVQMQEDLENFDKNQWKAHVLGAIGDTWNAYKMASMATTLAPGLFEATEKTVENIAEDKASDSFLDLDLADWDWSTDIGGPGWTSAESGGLGTTGRLP